MPSLFAVKSFVAALLIFSLFPIAALAEAHSTLSRCPGDIKLLPGYTNHAGLGAVSMFSVAQNGQIRSRNGFVISYSIVTFSGVIEKGANSQPKQLQSRPKLYYWYKEQVINGQRVLIWLLKNKSLCITFPDAYASFTTSPIRSEEDVADTLLTDVTQTPAPD